MPLWKCIEHDDYERLCAWGSGSSTNVWKNLENEYCVGIIGE